MARLARAWCRLTTRHHTDRPFYCEEDCCGSSLIWYECRCATWFDISGKRYHWDEVFA